MANPRVGTVLRQLHGTAPTRAVEGASDRDLLERFLAGREEAAFVALLRRHGPMVLSVCRRAGGNLQDAEDAFQATFLLLARKAGSIGKREAVASWLHGAAYRLAVEARKRAAARRRRERQAADGARPSAARERAWQELQAALEEALRSLPEVFRAPLLLCYLEGRTQEEAAKLLGCPLGTVRSRLARGRERLKQALEGQGVRLSALALAAALAAGTASAALPAPLLHTTARAALAGPAPARAAGLLERGALVVTAGKFKVVLAAALVLGALGFGTGATRQLTQPVRPGTADRLRQLPGGQPPAAPEVKPTVRGTVLLPDGKPAANVAILGRHTDEGGKVVDARLTTTDAAGRFAVERRRPTVLIAVAPGLAPAWAGGEFREGELTLRLAERAAVRGRLVDLEGRPVAGARVTVVAVKAPAGGNLKAVADAFRLNPEWTGAALPTQLAGPVPGSPAIVSTDSDGRFALDGLGKNRVAELHFEADGIESARAHVVLADDFDPKSVLPGPGERHGAMGREYRPAVYGPRFTHAVRPAHVITGVVTDATTGKPLPGVKVVGTAAPVQALNYAAWHDAAEVVTDREGRYRLAGLAKAPVRHLHFQAGDAPYLDRLVRVEDVAGYTPVSLDVKLSRAVVVEGLLLNQATGKPVRGTAFYLPLESDALDRFLVDNPAYSHDYSVRVSGVRAQAGADGRFRLRIPPAPGVVLARADTAGGPADRFTAARVAEADRKYLFKPPPGARLIGPRSDNEYFNTHRLISPLRWENGYALVHPAAGAEAVRVTIRFAPGRTVRGKVVGPDGRPLAGARAVGVQATDERGPTTLRADDFAVYALVEKQPRTVYFLHERKQLVGALTLWGGEEAPVVKMGPAAAVTGRVLDAAGKPLAGVEVSFQMSDAGPDELIRQKLYRGRVAPSTTDADGRFRLGGLFPGLEFSVFATQPGHRSGLAAFDPVTLKAGEVRDLGEKRAPGRQKPDEGP
jgi:RNA polymerase sigma factor (sigma-70 family)